MPPKRNEFEHPSASLEIASKREEVLSLGKRDVVRRPWYVDYLKTLDDPDEIVKGLWLGSDSSTLPPKASVRLEVTVDDRTSTDPATWVRAIETGGLYLRGGVKAEEIVVRIVSHVYQVSLAEAYGYVRYRRALLVLDRPPSGVSKPPSPRPPSPKPPSPRPPKTPPPKTPPPKGAVPQEYLDELMKCLRRSLTGPQADGLEAKLVDYYQRVKPLILREMSGHVDKIKAANPDDPRAIGFIRAIKAIRESNVPLYHPKIVLSIKIPNVGDSTREKINMILEYGELPPAEKRKEIYAKTGKSIAKFEALGIKPAARKKLIDLGIDSPTKLKAAYAKNTQGLPKLNAIQLYKLKNFTVPPKTIAPEEGQLLFGTVIYRLQKVEGLEEAFLAGDLRRDVPSAELKILVVGDVTASKLGKAFPASSGFKVLSGSSAGTLVLGTTWKGTPVVVEVSISSSSTAGLTLIKMTGPPKHHSWVLNRLKMNGITIDKKKAYRIDILAGTKDFLPLRTEEEVYQQINEAYPEPKDRKNE